MRSLLQDGPILPPRPNPGPEPWIDSQPWPGGLMVGIGLAMIAILTGLAIIFWRRSRRRRSRSKGIFEELEGSRLAPRDQMIVWSEAVRSALVDRFGPTWGARTTEEIARATELVDRFGSAKASQLAQFLAEADLAKFSDNAETNYHPEVWADWVVSFLAEPGDRDRSATKAGANSTIKGK